MNLREMMNIYYEDGLTRELASARVCQDIVLKAIAEGQLNHNVTIKGGVVMRSITKNNRRATRDIDLDGYSLFAVKHHYILGSYWALPRPARGPAPLTPAPRWEGRKATTVAF